MSVFYVFQGETYDEERSGGYVWSPQLNSAGHKNAGYTMMTEVKKGDFILHNSNGQIMAISVAQADCFEANQPTELSSAETSVTWNDEGYRINTKYYDFDVSVKATNYKEWLKNHYDPNSAFTSAGTGKQQYMCHLADEQAIFLLNKAIGHQTDDETLKNLKAALSEIIGDVDSEYDPAEVEEISDIIGTDDDEEIVDWPGIAEHQETTTSPSTGREMPKRNSKTAAKALKKAGYHCEFDRADRTFPRKTGKPYTEPHHLIPISKYREFTTSLDSMENIVSLCSNCHNLLHYGRLEDKVLVLKKLYNERKDALAAIGINLKPEQLVSYYK